MKKTDLSNLSSRIRIGEMDVRNRLVMPAMGSGLANEEGTPSDRMIHYYQRRAKGGAGLIIVELTAVHALGIAGPNSLRILEDDVVDSYKHLTEAVKSNGARIAVQLNHTGRHADPRLIKTQPVSSSPVPIAQSVEPPRELGVGEMESLVEAFIKGARRAKEAGFDAVELHGAHGYLIWQFLSPLCNKREDEYGGDIKGRLLFATQIVKGIKQELGKNFPLIFRISGNDFVDGGLTLGETTIMAQVLEEAGVDAIHVSGGNWQAMHWMIQPMMMPRACLAHLAETVRRKVSIPVIAVGRINDPSLAESILVKGQADLVSMGRGLLADPDLPRKAFEGDLETIRSCVACNTCIHQRLKGLPLACMINPEVGKEEGFILKAKRQRSILVVGGGPAGLETARIASLRGHDVTLYEKEPRLGGQVLLATKASYKKELESLVPYYVSQLQNLGVKVEIGKPMSATLAADIGPDALVLATGSIPSRPDIPGVAQPNVLTARHVLEGKRELSGKAVILGAGHVGCETAEYLACRGLQVMILEMTEDLLSDMDPISKPLVLERLEELRVRVILEATVTKISGKAVFYIDAGGERCSIEVDYVVLATGSTSQDSFSHTLKNGTFDFHAVGDCVKPRNVFAAISEGAHIARNL